MITQLQLKNFKCFQQSPLFKFSKINLLTGLNGRGKSSLLQAMLVLSQSTNRFFNLKILKLNGKHVKLGNYEDVKNSDTPRGESIGFNLKLDVPELAASIQFSDNEADSLTAALTTKEISMSQSSEIDTFIEKIDEFKNSVGAEADSIETNVGEIVLAEILARIHYISADRIGPVKYVDKISLPQFLTVGSRGEYAINILAKDDLPLINDILYRGSDAQTVLQQTEEWLSYILDGARIKISGKEKESSVLYMLINNRNSPYNYKPSNVGFGYSFILPIIVTGLIARPNDIIVIENPEAHLHPRAQSRITEFLAKVASCGIQVFIESHSEHILNGLRISALEPSIPLTHNDLTIQYFDESFESVNLSMDPTGRIKNWPNGFFDQQEIDLASIFKLGQ